MMKPSIIANPWDSCMRQKQLIISAMGSSKDAIDCWPQSNTMRMTMVMQLIAKQWMNGWCNDMPTFISIKLAPALPSLLKRLKIVFTHTELNALRQLTINKWRHCIFYARILMLLAIIVSVLICNWLQKLQNSKTLTEWLLSSVFAGMTLLSSMTGAFLHWWHGGTGVCLPWSKRARCESVNDHSATECNCGKFIRRAYTLQLENKRL